jgi:AcrR family transcriptional regulator
MQVTPLAEIPRLGEPESAGQQEPAPGRRQRKKQLTRDALIQAAIELFVAQGYEHTAVREITDAVDVSERTFFRYFASKEDLVLSFTRDGMTAFAEELACRPPEEEPFAAARAAFLASLRRLASAEGDLPPHLTVMRLIESTPVLLAAQLRFIHDHDEEIIQALAEREGVDPATDPRPRLLASIIGATTALANRDWLTGDNQDLHALAAAFDAYADQVIPALAGHWSAPR